MNAYRQMVNQPVTADLHVKTILFPEEGTVHGYAIFSGVDNQGKSIRCTGCFPGLSAGVPVRVNGTYQIYTDPKTGYETLEIKADGFSILKFILEKGYPVTLSSDAHDPSHICGHFGYASSHLADLGFRSIMVWKNGSFNDVSLTD